MLHACGTEMLTVTSAQTPKRKGIRVKEVDGHFHWLPNTVGYPLTTMGYPVTTVGSPLTIVGYSNHCRLPSNHQQPPTNCTVGDPRGSLHLEYWTSC